MPFFLRDVLIISIIRVSWQIVTDKDSSSGKEKQLALLADDRTSKKQFCIKMAAFRQHLLNPTEWLPSAPHNQINSPPEKQFSEVGICNYSVIRKTLECNFIEHSKCNMVCWLAVWIGLSHFSGQDEMIHDGSKNEKWCNIQLSCWRLCTAWNTRQMSSHHHSGLLCFPFNGTNPVYNSDTGD